MRNADQMDTQQPHTLKIFKSRRPFLGARELALKYMCIFQVGICESDTFKIVVSTDRTREHVAGAKNKSAMLSSFPVTY